MKLVVYASKTCPRCKQLKTMLQQKNISYEEITDTDKMLELGIRGNLPLLEVDDGERLPFYKAIPFIKSL